MRRAYPWIYGAILVAVLGDRLRLLIGFAARYTDKDQAVMWTAAHELLRGHFHEPRFFGQAYSSVAEGWLAAPLVALGMPIGLAVPTITILLAVAPFVLFSICAVRSNQRCSALVVLALPVLLPFDYALITSMPRGFVVGIAVASVAGALLGWRPRGPVLLAGSCLAGVAVSINPNAAICVIMFGLLAGLPRWNSPAFYRWAVPGVALAAVLHGGSALFYHWHPERLVYGRGVPGIYLPGVLDTSADAWLEGIRNLERFLGDVTPIFAGRPEFLGLIVILLVVGLIRVGARVPAVALAVTTAFTLGSLTLERVHLGSASVSWPWSRPYLAVPLVLALALPELERAVETRTRRRWLAAGAISILLLTAGVVVERSWRFGPRIRSALAEENRAETSAWSVETVRRRCGELAQMATRHDARLIVFQHEGEIMAYACEPLLGPATTTLLLRDVVAERRTWRLVPDPLIDGRGVLFYNVSSDQLARGREAGLRVGASERIHGFAVTAAVVGAEVDLFDLLVHMGLEGARPLRRRARLARE